MAKFRILFTDGSTEVVDVPGLISAWIFGKIRAWEKKTYLLKVEEIRGSPVEIKGSPFHGQLIIWERIPVPGPEVRRARI